MSRRDAVRVLHTLGSAQPGGVETFVLNLAMHLDRERVQLAVCIEDDDGPIAVQLRALDVPLKLLGRPSNAARAVSLYHCFRWARGDLLHTNSGGRLLRWTARAAGYHKLIVHLHGPPGDLPSDHPLAPRFARQTIGAAERIVVASHAMEAWIAKAAPELHSRTRQIYCGVDVASYAASGLTAAAEELRAAVGIASDHQVVGFVGRLVPQKGIAQLTEIMRGVLAQHSSVHFVIAGDGPLRPLIDSVSSQFADRCHFLGIRTDIPAIMRAINLLIVPSTWEPLGIVSIEAMLARRPVIAFDVDGIPEVVEHGRTGFLVRGQDVRAFVEEVAHLLNDRSLQARLGAAGYERALRLFDARTMAREFEEMYLQMAD